MNIFNKQPKFIAATCPKCGGRLELDADFEVAICADCGFQSIIQNAKKKKIRKTPLDKVIGFVERQQSIIRQDAQEKQRIEQEKQNKKDEIKHQKKEERKLWWQKHWLKVVIISMIIIILSFVANYLGL